MMLNEKITDDQKYLVTFDTKLLIEAKSYDEVIEKLKSELIRLLDEPVPKDTNLSIDPLGSTNQEEHELSYVDDWDFDDLW